MATPPSPSPSPLHSSDPHAHVPPCLLFPPSRSSFVQERNTEETKERVKMRLASKGKGGLKTKGYGAKAAQKAHEILLLLMKPANHSL